MKIFLTIFSANSAAAIMLAAQETASSRLVLGRWSLGFFLFLASFFLAGLFWLWAALDRAGRSPASRPLVREIIGVWALGLLAAWIHKGFPLPQWQFFAVMALLTVNAVTGLCGPGVWLWPRPSCGDQGRPGALAAPLSRGCFRAHVLSALIFGVVVRWWGLGDKPFWRDEAWVAFLTEQSLGTIMTSLDPVPAGLVLLAKLTGSFSLLPQEIGLRIIPFLAGIGVMALMPALVRLLGGSRRAGVLTVWLAAGCQPLIYYSRELKHYGLDVFLWLLGACLLLRFLAQRPVPGRHFVSLAALSLVLVLSPWFSFASLFPLTAALGLGLFACIRRGWRRELWMLAGCGGLYLASFLTALFVMIIPRANSPETLAFWMAPGRGAFVYDMWPSGEQVFQALYRAGVIPYHYFFHHAWFWLLPPFLLGLWVWARPPRGPHWAWLGLTALMAAGAALTNRYVLVDRLMLFMAPAYLAAVAQGGALFWENRAKRLLPGAVATVVAAALIGLSLAWGALAVLAREGLYPQSKKTHFYFDFTNNLQPTLDFLAQKAKPGEPVLLMAHAGTQYLYYQYRQKAPISSVTRWHHTRKIDPKAAMTAWLQSIAQRGWLVFMDSDATRWVPGHLLSQGYRARPAFAQRGSNAWVVELASGFGSAGNVK